MMTTLRQHIPDHNLGHCTKLKQLPQLTICYRYIYNWKLGYACHQLPVLPYEQGRS